MSFMAELEQSAIDQSEIDIAPLVTRAPTSRRLMELMRAPEAKPPAVRRVLRKRDQGNAHLLRDRCQKLCLSIFYREQAPARTLGFTSALAGEGKTFLAMMVATVLAGDAGVPVTLLECNWEHPTLHEHFDLPRTPGLAEWLRGEAVAAQVRHQVGDNLFVVPAGDGRYEAVQLLRMVRERGALARLAGPDGFLVADLPPVTAAAYGALAASLMDAVILVVRAGVTPDPFIQEAVGQLGSVRVEGVVLNQIESRIPRWLRQLL
jgi:Mrp family chromosome partitioning ATPase